MDVVVLAWNDEPEMLDAAVGSALNSREVDVCVWIVDNGSERPVTVGADPRVHVVRNATNHGVARGRAEGVALGAAPLVCLLDSDARLGSTCLAELAQVLQTDRSTALVAPVFVGQAPAASAGAAPTLGRKAARALGLTDRYRRIADAPDATTWSVDFAIGACQMIRRSAFEQVGGLDEAIFYGPEDVDLCLRLRYAGWHILQVESARCHHPPRRRNRRLLTRRGWAHARAVARHLRRHRRARRRGAALLAPARGRAS